MKVKFSQSCPTLCDPMNYTYSPWNSPGQNTGVGSLSPSPGDLSNPRIEPRSPTLQPDSLPAEPLGKPIYKIILPISQRFVFKSGEMFAVLYFN